MLSHSTYLDAIVGITAKAIIRHSTMSYTGISGERGKEKEKRQEQVI